jgi:acyl-CoA thioester hydrolase
MARVKIDLPEKSWFTATIPVRITDLNYGNHLGNDALLSIIHEARMQFLNSFGLSELAFAGASLIMADVAISYKGESFYGDVLSIEMAATDLSKYGFDLVYKISNQTGKAVAEAKTGMLCFDYNARKLMALPAEVKAEFETKIG